MTVKKPSLAEFALSKAPPPCRVCVLPECAEINEALRSGMPRRVMLEWLHVVRGYEPQGPEGVSASAMDKHAMNRHAFKESGS